MFLTKAYKILSSLKGKTIQKTGKTKHSTLYLCSKLTFLKDVMCFLLGSLRVYWLLKIVSSPSMLL